jgi:hypothetical protein
MKVGDRDLFELESVAQASVWLWLRCDAGGKQSVS